MILENSLVIPYNSRPDVNVGSLFKADDLTTLYVEIIRCVDKIYKSQGDKVDSQLMDGLYSKINNIISSDLNKNHGNKEYMDLKKKTQGKNRYYQTKHDG